VKYCLVTPYLASVGALAPQFDQDNLMRPNLKNSILIILISLCLCTPCPASFAADGKSEALWFVNLIKENNGKTFCAPPNATVKDLALAFARFSDAHPEFNDRLTTTQTINGLAEAYPCKTISRNTPIAELAKSGEKNIIVRPTGEFASIDNSSIISTTQKLRATLAHENDVLVNQMIKNSGSYAPPSLFSLADLLYRRGDVGDSIFWFNAARLRGEYDAALCPDISAKATIPALISKMPRDLIKRQYDDIPQIKNIVERIIKWDESTPYNYDHRWISLHGMSAISNGVGMAVQRGPLLEPRESWERLAKQNRDQFRQSIDETIRALHAYDVPVKLGDTIEKAKTAYQTVVEPKPANIPERPAVKFLQVPGKGTWLFFDEAGEIYTIRLERPFQGQVVGVKIGDSLDSVLHTLGNPRRRLPVLGLPDSFVYQPGNNLSTNIRFNRSGTVEAIYVSR
jgi:hypothetical protein